MKAIMIVVTALILGAAFSARVNAQQARHPALARIADDPSLPRVLLIGDSISMGYTLPARRLLKGKANVHRIPTNGRSTAKGLSEIEQWLGDGKWDVIHFNWGLHDLKFIDGAPQVPIDDYEQNLRKLVKRLKKTGAKLIWCTTTPVPDNVTPPRSNDDVLAYNGRAAKIMQANEIAVNDLCTFAGQRLSDIQKPHNVHFTREGSEILAEQVGRAICAALEEQ